MNNINDLEKANFRALIESDGNDRIQDRLNILDVFLGIEEHITLEELSRLLRERGHVYEPEFLRHCMNRMVDLGFAQKKHFEDQPIRYEHRHLGRHHDHLVCTKCGRIVEFTDDALERLQLGIAANLGFHMLQHRMEIYGICDDCQTQRRPLMPLTSVRSGERVTLREMTGGGNAKARLAGMGLRLGDRVEVINNTGQGRIILAHGQTRLAIGRGIAEQIVVSLSGKEMEVAQTEPDRA